MFMDSACACDGLFPLPVEEKTILWTWRALAMGFSSCLSRKRLSHGLGVRLRGPFPPARRGKADRGDVACALARPFSPCLSRKRQSHGHGVRLRFPFPLCLSRKRQSWEHGMRLRFPFPPACRGKGNHGNMACACDSLSTLPVEEKAIMGTWRALAIPFSLCLSRKRQTLERFFLRGYRRLRALERGVRLRFPFPPACRGKGDHGNMACACDSLSILPVEEKAIMGTWRALAMPFSPCLSRKRQSW